MEEIESKEKEAGGASHGRGFKVRLRGEIGPLGRFIAGATCLLLLILLWVVTTYGPAESRVVGPGILPSPSETLASFHSLWFERALTRNIFLSLWRVLQGFGLAVLVGVPLGVLCGTWPGINAFFAPLQVFGRNVPISTLLPLVMAWFGLDELQKVMFYFVATVMFVVFDSARAIANVPERYVQTALTLGARPLQVLYKVLVPLALPEIFGSLRLLFGLAFGYVALAESINANGGVGMLILVARHPEAKQHIYLILISITLVAYAIDRLFYFVGKKLFPYREAS